MNILHLLGVISLLLVLTLVYKQFVEYPMEEKRSLKNFRKRNETIFVRGKVDDSSFNQLTSTYWNVGKEKL